MSAERSGATTAEPSLWQDLPLDLLEVFCQALGGVTGAALALGTGDASAGLASAAGGTLLGGSLGGVLRRLLVSRRQRATALAEALSDVAKLRLCEDGALGDEDLLHAILLAIEKASRTHRDEKVRLFGRLLDGFILGRVDRETDEYEEMLSILDDLSCREMGLLVLLDDCEHDSRTRADDDPNELQRAMLHWDEFLGMAPTEAGVAPEQVPGMLARLARTGLYKPIVGSYYGYAGDMGCITPYFSRFAKAMGLGEADSECGDEGTTVAT